MTEKTQHGVEKRFSNVSQSKTFSNIRNFFDLKNKKVLDIGCSYGEFLAHCGKESVGLTVSDEEVAYGNKKGLAIKKCNIETEDPRFETQFDVIFANNIFEHLYSPHGFLAKIKQYLKPNGILILGVPCVPILSSLMRFKKFRGALAVSHINFFTKRTLEKTVERAGWEIYMTRSFHFKYAILDRILDLISPHFYVVASPIQEFEYHEKRKKELEAYQHD